MNKTCKALLTRMVVNIIVGNKKAAWRLYDLYYKEQRLHVPIEEILQAKEGAA